MKIKAEICSQVSVNFDRPIDIYTYVYLSNDEDSICISVDSEDIESKDIYMKLSEFERAIKELKYLQSGVKNGET